jgi:hypothetical protein
MGQMSLVSRKMITKGHRKPLSWPAPGYSWINSARRRNGFALAEIVVNPLLMLVFVLMNLLDHLV